MNHTNAENKCLTLGGLELLLFLAEVLPDADDALPDDLQFLRHWQQHRVHSFAVGTGMREGGVGMELRRRQQRTDDRTTDAA